MSQPVLPQPPHSGETTPLTRSAATAGGGQIRRTKARPATGVVGKTKHVLGSGLDSLRGGLVQGQHRLRHLVDSTRKQAPVSRRPDGTIVALSPVRVRSASTSAGLVDRIVAPVRAVETAVKERWDDSIREARLAARDKETDMRADYERRVHHDARLHAEQHNKRQDGG